MAEATALVRDLVDTPSADMGPAELEAIGRASGRNAFGAKIEVTAGDKLAKGLSDDRRRRRRRHGGARATPDRAALGQCPSIPSWRIIGKGVCFDSGGLDLKPAGGMRLMKKDMGGAAHALALAGLIMGAKLPVRLHLLVPAVENAVSGGAYRPGDVLTSARA